MKIIRNEKEIELTPEEMKQAYYEMKDKYTIEDFRSRYVLSNKNIPEAIRLFDRTIGGNDPYWESYWSVIESVANELSLQENDVVFQNDLIKIIWNDTRLVLLDSDGEFVDYFFDCCFFEEDEQNEMIQSIINDVDGADEGKLCRWISDYLDSVLKIEPFGGDEKTLKKLREQWGDEYVNRVGNTALIIKE